MRKLEYLYVHGLLVELSQHLSERGAIPAKTPPEYDVIETRPLSVQASKRDHHEAVMVLSSAIALELEQPSDDVPSVPTP